MQKVSLTIQHKLLELLTLAFPRLNRLEIVDFTDPHRSHHSVDPGKQSHFAVLIEDNSFADMSHIDRHRAVNKAVDSLKHEIHALQLKVRVPS